MTPIDPPVLLLDLDGVINASGPYADVYHKTKRRFNPYWDCKMASGLALGAGGKQYTIWWAPPLVDQLVGLHIAGLVEIRWCSTWNSYIEPVEDLLGLPHLPLAFPTAGVHWRNIARLKRQAAANVLDREGRPLVWADDQEVPFTWEPAHAIMEADGRALLIRPKEALGLLPGDLDQIELFAIRHANYPIDPETEEVMP